MTAAQTDLDLGCTPTCRRIRAVSEKRKAMRAFMAANKIKTHCAPLESVDKVSRWLAVLVPDKRLDNGESIAGMEIPEMTAHFGRLLEESGRTAYAATEREAVFLLAEENHLQGADFWP